MHLRNENFVLTLARSARETISEDYYDVEDARLPRRSLRRAIEENKGTPLITEVKFHSPAEGALRSHGDVREIARAYQRGGASGISVLTEPKHFEGSLEYLTSVKRAVTIPVLMKDIIIARTQIEAARRAGADAILLMASIFTNALSDFTLSQMIGFAHDADLEVLLEAHAKDEYELALASQADLVGINNRDLNTLEVSLDTSRRLLKSFPHGKPVVCESGISKRSEILELETLGADGFLIGSSLMKSKDLERAVRDLAGE